MRYHDYDDNDWVIRWLVTHERYVNEFNNEPAILGVEMAALHGRDMDAFMEDEKS